MTDAPSDSPRIPAQDGLDAPLTPLGPDGRPYRVWYYMGWHMSDHLTPEQLAQSMPEGATNWTPPRPPTPATAAIPPVPTPADAAVSAVVSAPVSAAAPSIAEPRAGADGEAESPPESDLPDAPDLPDLPAPDPYRPVTDAERADRRVLQCGLLVWRVDEAAVPPAGWPADLRPPAPSAQRTAADISDTPASSPIPASSPTPAPNLDTGQDTETTTGVAACEGVSDAAADAAFDAARNAAPYEGPPVADRLLDAYGENLAPGPFGLANPALVVYARRTALQAKRTPTGPSGAPADPYRPWENADFFRSGTRYCEGLVWRTQEAATPPPDWPTDHTVVPLPDPYRPWQAADADSAHALRHGELTWRMDESAAPPPGWPDDYRPDGAVDTPVRRFLRTLQLASAARNAARVREIALSERLLARQEAKLAKPQAAPAAPVADRETGPVQSDADQGDAQQGDAEPGKPKECDPQPCDPELRAAEHRDPEPHDPPSHDGAERSDDDILRAAQELIECAESDAPVAQWSDAFQERIAAVRADMQRLTTRQMAAARRRANAAGNGKAGDGMSRIRPRRNGWTPRLMADFLRALSATQSVQQAAKQVGKSRQCCYTLHDRMQGTPFALAWEAALEAGLSQLAQAALGRAIHGVEVPHYCNGELVGTSRKFNESLTKWLLANPARLGRQPEAREWALQNWDAMLARVEQGDLEWVDADKGRGGGGDDTSGPRTADPETFAKRFGYYAEQENAAARALAAKPDHRTISQKMWG